MTKLAIALGAWAVLTAAGALAQDSITDENVLIRTPDGAQISAFVVRRSSFVGTTTESYTC